MDRAQGGRGARPPGHLGDAPERGWEALTSGSALSSAEAKAFYDRFGARQDAQGFYEDAAIEKLLCSADFSAADRVFELGFGTGKLAHRLLSRELAEHATYVGVDVSSTMMSLARERLAPFGVRVELSATDGSMSFAYPDASFDRFVATYVLDLLSESEIAAALDEARRLLCPGGRLCVAGLTVGERFPSSLVSRLWAWIQAAHPAWVGGCRPLRIVDFVAGDGFRVLHREVVTGWAIPSEVFVAEAV